MLIEREQRIKKAQSSYLFVEREQGKQKKAQSKSAPQKRGVFRGIIVIVYDFVYLSKQFYTDYALCTEIEQKESRPHIRLLIWQEGLCFAVPLRSHITHPYAYLTDKTNLCGIDFSKAVLITDEQKYIDRSQTPRIRQHEYNAMKGKEKVIERGMVKYLAAYRKARTNPTAAHNSALLKYSTLKYFDSNL